MNFNDSDKVKFLVNLANCSAYKLRDKLDVDMSLNARIAISKDLKRCNSLLARLLVLLMIIEPENYEIFENRYNEVMRRR